MLLKDVGYFIIFHGIIAIDLGVKTLVHAITDDGKQIKIPKFSHETKHLDELRSKRDKKVKGSRRYKKINRTYHKRLNQYKNRVMDYLHKTTYWLTNYFDETTIVVGDLNLKNMKTEMSWFNRIIMNEWRVGKFVELLKYKTKKFGKVLVKINEAYTTKDCCVCNNRKEMKLSDRVYKCICELEIDRDLNSAINILKKYCTASALVSKDTKRFVDLVSANNLIVTYKLS